MKKMLFSEYLESKEKLREAAHRTPQRTIEYIANRHCRLMVQNSEGKQYLPLNPGALIYVIWLYEDRKKPLPVRIYFKNVNSVSEDDRFYTTWSGEKLNNWLKKNSDSR